MVSNTRLIRFVFVGGTTAVVQLSLTWMFVSGLRFDVLVGSTIAATMAAMYNYLLHYHWTFSSDVPHGWTLVKYLLMCVGALFVNGIVMHVGVEVFGIYYLFVQLLAGMALTIWSFIVSSFWVFARKSS